MGRRAALFWLFATLMLPPTPADAHKPSDSYLALTVTDTAVEGQWDIALRDLDYAIGLDGNDDGAITWGELRARHDAIAAYALSRLDIRRQGTRCTTRAVDHLVDDHSDGAYAVLRFAVDCPRTLGALDLGYSLFFDVDPQHRGLFRADHGGTSRTGVFSADRQHQTVELEGTGRWRQFLSFCWEGVWHIWAGFDHILFLITLLLPAVLSRQSGQWQAVSGFRQAFFEVFKVVTAFTVAHSVTLSLAALQVIALPSRLVESLIAASVVVAALNNLYPLVTRRLWVIAFGFGLVHGFGFAAVLTDLGLPRDALLLSLFAFNLGVEAGQLAVVSAFLPLAFAVRRSNLYPRLALKLGSLAIAGLASLWFIERAFDVAPFVPWNVK